MPPGLSAAAMPVQHRTVLAVGGHQAECPLAQADRGVELVVERQRAGIEAFERRTGRRSLRRQFDEPLADVDAVDHHSSPCQLVRVPARPAADVEHAVPGVQPQRLDDEVDLLRRALGERVPQVRRSQMLRDGLEPMTHSFPLWHDF